MIKMTKREIANWRWCHRQASQRPMICPHCGLPPVLPDVCTPEVHDAIERLVAHDWEMFNAGYEAGKQSALDVPASPVAPGTKD